jgi:membrane protein required for colicin V production
MESLNNYDIALLAMVGIFAVLGLYWGLIRQVLAVAGIVVGIVLAGRFGETVAGWLSSFVISPQVASAAGFVLVVIFVSSIASLIASFLRIFVGLLFLGWLDHFLGALLGILQAVIVGAIVTIAMVVFPDPAWQQLLIGSRFATPFLQFGSLLSALLPDTFQAAVATVLGQ